MPRTPQKQIILTQEQYTDLVTRLEKLSSGQDEIKLDLATRRHIDEKVSEIDKTLTGNGKWGFSKLRDWAMSTDEENRFYKRFVITMTATNIVSLIVAAFFWFIKVLPVLDKLQQAGL